MKSWDRVAVDIMFQAHDGQVDKSGRPYYLHPMRVAMMGFTTTERILGYLHDVLEDAPEYEGLIRQYFGELYDSLVVLTHKKNEPYSDYIGRILESKDADIISVKVWDLRDNMSRIENIIDWGTRDRLRTKYVAAQEQISSYLKKEFPLFYQQLIL